MRALKYVMGVALLMLVGCAEQGNSRDAFSTPRAMREDWERSIIETMKNDLQSGKSFGASIRLCSYYKRLDRSLTNCPLLRTGSWPQGHYVYEFRMTNEELTQLRRILAQLELVPLKEQEKSKRWANVKDDERHASRIGLSLNGVHTGWSLEHIRKQLVPASQAATAAQQMVTDGFCYSLPDAEYEAFMALPSVRKAEAALKKYQHAPAPFFTSVEEQVSREHIELLHRDLPRANHAELMLDMRYPKLENKESLSDPLELTPYTVSVMMSAEELAQLKDILTRLEAVPMRDMVPFTAAPRKSDEPYSNLSLYLREHETAQPSWLSDIGHSIIRRSERQKAASLPHGDRVNYMLPDADFEAFMALPSIRRALEWTQQYHDAPADFFDKIEDPDPPPVPH